MATDGKTIYLPRMRTRPGQTHSYQSTHDVKVVTVDEKGPVERGSTTTRSRTRGTIAPADDSGK